MLFAKTSSTVSTPSATRIIKIAFDVSLDIAMAANLKRNAAFVDCLLSGHRTLRARRVGPPHPVDLPSIALIEKPGM